MQVGALVGRLELLYFGIELVGRGGRVHAVQVLERLLFEFERRLRGIVLAFGRRVQYDPVQRVQQLHLGLVQLGAVGVVASVDEGGRARMQNVREGGLDERPPRYAVDRVR